MASHSISQPPPSPTPSQPPSIDYSSSHSQQHGGLIWNKGNKGRRSRAENRSGNDGGDSVENVTPSPPPEAFMLNEKQIDSVQDGYGIRNSDNGKIEESIPFLSKNSKDVKNFFLDDNSDRKLSTTKSGVAKSPLSFISSTMALCSNSAIEVHDSNYKNPRFSEHGVSSLRSLFNLKKIMPTYFRSKQPKANIISTTIPEDYQNQVVSERGIKQYTSDSSHSSSKQHDLDPRPIIVVLLMTLILLLSFYSAFGCDFLILDIGFRPLNIDFGEKTKFGPFSFKSGRSSSNTNDSESSSGGDGKCLYYPDDFRDFVNISGDSDWQAARALSVIGAIILLPITMIAWIGAADRRLTTLPQWGFAAPASWSKVGSGARHLLKSWRVLAFIALSIQFIVEAGKLSFMNIGICHDELWMKKVTGDSVAALGGCSRSNGANCAISAMFFCFTVAAILLILEKENRYKGENSRNCLYNIIGADNAEIGDKGNVGKCSADSNENGKLSKRNDKKVPYKSLVSENSNSSDDDSSSSSEFVATKFEENSNNVKVNGNDVESDNDHSSSDGTGLSIGTGFSAATDFSTATAPTSNVRTFGDASAVTVTTSNISKRREKNSRSDHKKIERNRNKIPIEYHRKKREGVNPNVSRGTTVHGKHKIQNKKSTNYVVTDFMPNKVDNLEINGDSDDSESCVIQSNKISMSKRRSGRRRSSRESSDFCHRPLQDSLMDDILLRDIEEPQQSSETRVNTNVISDSKKEEGETYHTSKLKSEPSPSPPLDNIARISHHTTNRGKGAKLNPISKTSSQYLADHSKAPSSSSQKGSKHSSSGRYTVKSIPSHTRESLTKSPDNSQRKSRHTSSRESTAKSINTEIKGESSVRSSSESSRNSASRSKQRSTTRSSRKDLVRSHHSSSSNQSVTSHKKHAEKNRASHSRNSRNESSLNSKMKEDTVDDY